MAEAKVSQLIDTNLLDPSLENAQEMSAFKFNKLVESIKLNGFDENVIVMPIEGGRYRIVSGEHRWRAAVMLEMKQVPCVIQNFDDDQRKAELIKRNALHGKINPQKFVALWEDLLKRHTKDELVGLMAMESDELQKLIASTRSKLPESMKKEFDKTKDEIKTIDDLSRILNQLFAKYGNTVKYHFMFIEYGKTEHLWIQCDDELWAIAQKIASACAEQEYDINKAMSDVMKRGFETLVIPTKQQPKGGE